MPPSTLQSTYQTAIKFAGEKHATQLVPGSAANYLLHLSNVAMEVLVAWAHAQDFDVEFAIQLALLHDSLEDTETSIEELTAHFSHRVATGVAALTKDDSLPTKQAKMQDSLHRINQLEKEVGLVKLADRITNLQAPPAHWSPEKRARYLAEAKIIADALIGKNAYLNQRLLERIEAYGGFF